MRNTKDQVMLELAKLKLEPLYDNLNDKNWFDSGNVLTKLPREARDVAHYAIEGFVIYSLTVELFQAFGTGFPYTKTGERSAKVTKLAASPMFMACICEDAVRRGYRWTLDKWSANIDVTKSEAPNAATFEASVLSPTPPLMKGIQRERY